jgi:ribosomal subunit interface protein
MDLVLKGRGHRVSDRDRIAAGKKLGRLTRINPRIVRCEVEILAEKRPRLSSALRIEAAVEAPRRTFRASAEGRDVDSALDGVVGRLERQLRDDADKRKTRTTRGIDRLQSAPVGDDIPLD